MPTYRIEVETTGRHFLTIDADNSDQALQLAAIGAVEPENISDQIEGEATPVSIWVCADDTA